MLYQWNITVERVIIFATWIGDNFDLRVSGCSHTSQDSRWYMENSSERLKERFFLYASVVDLVLYAFPTGNSLLYPEEYHRAVFHLGAETHRIASFEGRHTSHSEHWVLQSEIPKPCQDAGKPLGTEHKACETGGCVHHECSEASTFSSAPSTNCQASDGSCAML